MIYLPPLALPASIILYAGRACARLCRSAISLAIGDTGVLQRAYGGKGRDGIRETHTNE